MPTLLTIFGMVTFFRPVCEVLTIHYSAEFERISHIAKFFVAIFFAKTRNG